MNPLSLDGSSLTSAGSRGRFAALQRPDQYTQTGARYGYSPARMYRNVVLEEYRPMLSETSSYISHDEKTTTVLSKANAKAEQAEADRRYRTLASREYSRRELHRRKAERETIENYIQTPHSLKQGIPKIGCNVVEDRMRFLRQRFARAERFGAVEAMQSLEKFMRHNQLRVSDLFAHVDVDGSGTIDKPELQNALKAVNLELSDPEVDSLFQFLDTTQDGLVQIDELEGAIRQFRRFRFEKEAIIKHEQKVADMRRAGLDPTGENLTDYDDDRRHEAIGRLVAAGGGGGGEDEADAMTLRTSSLPMIGQQLMTMNLEMKSEPTELPKSIYELQSRMAVERESKRIAMNQIQSGQRAIKRREEIQDRLMRQREARILLQEKSHQKKNLAVQTKMRYARH